MLTRNEIIELRARAMFDANYSHLGDVGYMWEGLKEIYYDMAKASIEADEKAGVLMLVSGAPEIGDITTYEYPALYTKKLTTDTLIWDGNAGTKSGKEFRVIQRANTPVYQCAKEKTNDQ